MSRYQNRRYLVELAGLAALRALGARWCFISSISYQDPSNTRRAVQTLLNRIQRERKRSMDNVIKFPQTIKSPLFGPMQEHYRIVVEDRLIPHLTGAKAGDTHTAIVVDERFSISVPNDLAYQVAWLCAQAIAVASGYSHIAAESKSAPFAPIVSPLNI